MYTMKHILLILVTIIIFTGSADAIGIITNPEFIPDLKSTSIQITWENPNTPFMSILIVKSESPITWQLKDGEPYTKAIPKDNIIYDFGGTYYRDRNVNIDTNYYYKIIAYDKNFNYSTGVTATEMPVSIQADCNSGNVPCKFRGSATSSSVQLTWQISENANQNFNKFLIRQGSDNDWEPDDRQYEVGIDNIVCIEKEKTSCDVTDLEMGTTHQFTLYAYSMPVSDGITEYKYSEGVTTEVKTHLGGTLSHDLVLERDVYIVDETIIIPNNTMLYINEDCILQFQPQTSIQVQGGQLDAKHSQFTCVDPDNQWQGILFQDSEAGGLIEKCSFQNASGDNSGKAILNIHDASPTIKECIILDHNAAYGIYIDGKASPNIFNNQIQGKEYTVRIDYSNQTAPLFKNNQYGYSRNGNFLIEGTIDGAVHWTDEKAIYHLSHMTVASGGSLDITGNTIKVNENACIDVQGCFTAKNTFFTVAYNKNDLTRTTGMQWQGIRFKGSTHSALDNCKIERASGNADEFQGIIHISESCVIIDHVKIQNCLAQYGIYIQSGNPIITYNSIEKVAIGIFNGQEATTQAIVANSFLENEYAIKLIYGSDKNPPLNLNTYQDSMLSDVYVSGNIRGNVSWNESAAHYTIKDITIEKGAALNITQNHMVRLEEGIPFVVEGTLNAHGVIFSSTDKYVHWKGIQFNNASAGELIDCVISQATGNGLTEGVIHMINSSPVIQNCTLINNISSSGITIQRNSSPHITENTITHMNNFGIYISNQSSPIISDNILMGNGYGIGIQYDPENIMNPGLNNNVFSDNISGDVMLGGHIYTKVKWEGGKTYRLNSNLIIEKGAELAIEEKAIVRSDKDIQIHVLGTLIANNVTFTWADHLNQWNGIQFEGTSSDKSKLFLCTIERANGYTRTEYMGIISFENSNASIRHCQIKNSLAQYGISIHNASPVIHHNIINEMNSYGILVSGNASPEIYTNTFNRNFRAARIDYNAESMCPLLKENKYIDSADGDIDVMGIIKANTCWGDNETPVYRLISNANATGLTIDAVAELNIFPGVDIRAEKNTQICVKGTLKAKESSFSWADGQNQWNGIMFDASFDSILEDCTIENASGYRTFEGLMGVIYMTNSATPQILTTNILNCNANIGINVNNSDPSIRNCLIRGLEKGMYIRTNRGPIINNNTFENNLFAIDIKYMADNHTTQLINNTYLNNHQADIGVQGTIKTDITWGDEETPVYQVNSRETQTSENKGLTINSGATLKINPNVIVKNEADTQIQVRGTIEADNVLFTWADSKNMWNGIKIEGNATNRSFLKNCTIEHAKGYNNGNDGIIYMKHSTAVFNDNKIINCIARKGIQLEDSSPRIENNMIDGINTGILVNGLSEPIMNHNTFQNNEYAMHLIYGTGTPILTIETHNIFYNNEKGDIYTSGIISTDVIWDNKCSTIYFIDQLTITSNAMLTIAPGNTVKFQSNGCIISEGVLNAENVLFTHMDGEKTWQGITFKSYGANDSQLSNCVFEGAEGFLNASQHSGIIHISNSSPYIYNCIFQNTHSLLGISIDNASPIIQGNLISGMAKGIELQGQSRPQIINNHLIHNLVGIETTYPENQPIIKDNFFQNNNHSDVSVSGTIAGEINWESNNCKTDYYAYSLCIDIGASLNIHQGITVKYDKEGFFHVKGKLTAKDVLFTWSNANYQWSGILFDGIGIRDSVLENCHFTRSSGFEFSPEQSGIIYVHETSGVKGFPQIIDCTFRDSIADVGIYIDNGHPLISHCLIEGMAHGMYITNQSAPDVINNTIKNNMIGIFLDGNVSGNYSYNSFTNNSVYGFFNNGATTVNAMSNYWGDAAGPLDTIDNSELGGLYNPDSKGDEVSNYVNYDSWIGKNPIQKGDINGDGSLSLKDVIIALQINAGIYPSGIILLSSDAYGYQQIGVNDILCMFKLIEKELTQ